MKPVIWGSLNWFDVVIVGILTLSIIISFFRGFLREAISLLTWVVAVLVALKFAGPLSSEFSNHLESASLRYLISFVLLFVIVLIIGAVINLIIKVLVEKVGIGFFDRVLGVIFGAARGILAVTIMLMLLSVGTMQQKPWYAGSQLAPQFSPLVTWLKGFIPEKMRQVQSWLGNGEKIL